MQSAGEGNASWITLFEHSQICLRYDSELQRSIIEVKWNTYTAFRDSVDANRVVFIINSFNIRFGRLVLRPLQNQHRASPASVGGFSSIYLDNGSLGNGVLEPRPYS